MVIAVASIIPGPPVRPFGSAGPFFGRPNSRSATRWHAGARQSSPTVAIGPMHLAFSGSVDKSSGLTIHPARLHKRIEDGNRDLISQSVKTRQCLSERRDGDIETRAADINTCQLGLNRQTRIDDARCRLKSAQSNTAA